MLVARKTESYDAVMALGGLASSTLTLWCGAAQLWIAAPSGSAPRDEIDRPWTRGTLAPRGAIEFGYSREFVSLGVGLGLTYFVVPGLALGLGLEDTILLYSADLQARIPNLHDEVPTNMLRITPSIQWVFVRRPRFSPYLRVGMGPTLFNNHGGTFGHWRAEPGVFVALVGPLYLDLGVGFSGMFPTARCNDVFAPVQGVCSFSWGPRLGFVASFATGRRREPNPRRGI